MKDNRNERLNQIALESALQEEKLTTEPVITRSKGSFVKWLTLAIVVAGMSVLAFYLPKMSKGKDPHKAGGDKNRPVPVVVATATTGSLPIEVRTIGNVLPYSVVNVVPQVGGQLLKVHFKQGDLVKKGQLLFEIDPRPYQAALAQAKGTVAKDLAMMHQAQANLNRDIAGIGTIQANLKRDHIQSKFAVNEMHRYRELAEVGAVSREQSDQMRTNALSADATVQATGKQIENAQAVVEGDKAAIETARGALAADEAAVDNAKIQLGYTKIYSPLEGRTGSLNVYEGNVVAANNTTPLVTIDQVHPIYVNFTVPEEYLDQLRRAKEAGTLKVTVKVEGIKDEAYEGKVSFLEHTVNTTTGTMTMRAQLENANHRLYAGQFVDVIASMPADRETVLVPSQAVQNTQNGQAVYVLEKDGTVDLKPVKVIRSRRGKSGVDGIQAGDKVVIDGTMQITPGSKVRVVKSHEEIRGDSGEKTGDRRRSSSEATGATAAGDKQ